MAYEDNQNRGQLPFTPGSPVIFTLGANYKVLRGSVIVRGSLVVSGGTTSGTQIDEGGPAGLVRHIKVTANAAAGSRYPNGEIVNCTPRDLLRFAITERNGKFYSELAASVLGSGAAGTYPIYMEYPIYFADSTNKNDVQTALNMDPVDSTGAPVYQSVQVKVDLAADLTDCFVGNDRTCDFSGLTVSWQDDRLALPFDTVPMVQEGHDVLIMAAQRRMLDQAMPLNGAFSTWLIMALQNTEYNTLSDAILNRLKVKSPTLDYEKYAQDTRADMFNDAFYDPSTTAVGQFYIDWTKGASIANSNAAVGMSIEFDVNNPSGAGLDALRIYTRRIFALSS